VIWYQMFLEESVTFVRTLKVGVEIQTSKVIFSKQVALDFLYQSGILKSCCQCIEKYVEDTITRCIL
jgi:hypothetical protein